MKILLGILGLTVSLGLPLFGQEPQAVSADVRSQVEAVLMLFSLLSLSSKRPALYANKGARGS
jgi:hypothetical protein